MSFTNIYYPNKIQNVRYCSFTTQRKKTNTKKSSPPCGTYILQLCKMHVHSEALMAPHSHSLAFLEYIFMLHKSGFA